MTVVDGGGGSVQKMKNAGHPNVMVYQSVDPAGMTVRSENIAKHFESTATVTKTTTTKQKRMFLLCPKMVLC